MTVKNMTKYFTRASATYCGIWRRLYLASRGRGVVLQNSGFSFMPHGISRAKFSMFFVEIHGVPWNSPTSWPTFRDVWPRNGSIQWSVGSFVIHPMKIQHFLQCRVSHAKATEPRPTKFCQMSEGLLSTVKISGKFVPTEIRPQPKLTFSANTIFATSALDTAYLRNETLIG